MPRSALPILLAAVFPVDTFGNEPSFLNDVMPILTRQGCNQGACHGKEAGQNGFRLSLRGYAPESDHRWLTREFGSRRVDPAVPERSLLLTKPTGTAPHEGGKLFEVGGREHQILHDWIVAGSPGPRADDPTLERLELTPESAILSPGETIRLGAVAHFSDGGRRDVTWLAKFESNDAGVVSVSGEGLAVARRSGVTAIRAAFQSEVAVAVLTVPYPEAVPRERFPKPNNLIDTHVYDRLRSLNVEPSPLADDAEFLRRAHLDAIGTLPTPDEVRAFLADRSPDKRVRLIDELLGRQEWVDYWTLQLADLLQNRVERDHDVRGAEGVKSFHDWLRRRVAENRPWDELVREVLTARGPAKENPAVGYYIVTVGEARESHKSEVVASVAQAFLGTRIGCAQCHNHPLERYTQDDYYRFAAFFSRMKFDRQKPDKGDTVLHVSTHNPKDNDRPVGVVQPRTGQFVEPRPLDRSAVDLAPGDDPRVKLADWMTDPNNEAFGGAMVNRVWKHFMGVGLVEPVDDLRATNPPTNPALWAELNRDFVAGGFDLKRLMRSILNSRAYQTSAVTLPGNRADDRFYSHYYARRLPAEVFADAISQATGVADEFPDYPKGTRAVRVPDPRVKSDFLEMFGRSDRVTACACERSGEVTLPQLLHLRNGEAIHRKLTAGDGRLNRLLADQPDDARVIEELYLWTVSRPPTAEESARLAALRGPEDDRREFFRDLFWALLNSKDFAFNH